jgi:superfamily II DNA or RNA helicase
MIHGRKELTIVPRDYQTEDMEESFKQWDAGIVGTLTRAATGTGKTPMAAMNFDRWLDRGDDYRCMVISYEQQLVWQFAQEIEQFLHVTPGIEMGTESVKPGQIPTITIASRQSLKLKEPATREQRDALLQFGISEVGLLTKDSARPIISELQKCGSPEIAKALIEAENARPEVNIEANAVARLFKFDWRYNWLVVYDEAHKYKYGLKTVKPIVDWFERNPNSRRKGLTATPKRFDGVNIGDKMFPGITLDLPLYTIAGRCAVKDGYAVPYVQKYISVEGVDFKALTKIAGDYSEEELGRLLGTEETLAKLCEPMLDLIGDRKTLVFSPTIEMAKSVAAYVNARYECWCQVCDKVAWYAKPLVTEGTTCKCGAPIKETDITKSGEQALCVYGSVPKRERKEIYRQHKDGTAQMLSVVGLCREGFNDPDIACVTVFRPVSKAASSLAEQMKGRASRPLRGLIEGMSSAEERLEAIRNSDKPSALVIDLVGITGLADCASTAMIYADGLDDEVIERADEIALLGGVQNMDEVVQRAAREVEQERAEAKRLKDEERQREREEAERRSKARAEARYSVHEIGHNSDRIRLPTMASEKQLKFIRFLGIDLIGSWEPSKKQAGRMIDQLTTGGEPPQTVCYTNGIKDEWWKPSTASVAQMRLLARHGINAQGMTPKHASDAIERIKGGAPEEHAAAPQVSQWVREISEAGTQGELDVLSQRVSSARRSGQIPDAEYEAIKTAGREMRELVF